MLGKDEENRGKGHGACYVLGGESAEGEGGADAKGANVESIFANNSGVIRWQMVLPSIFARRSAQRQAD